MRGLAKPAVCAAWMGVFLAVGCSNGDSGGQGADRGGPTKIAPGVMMTMNQPPASGGVAGAGDFNNSPGMTTTRPPPTTVDAGFNTTTNPDDVKCGGAKFTPMIEKTIIPGNILLIADKSGSMMQNFPTTMTQKGMEARNSIANAITSLKDMVKVGAVFFPDNTGCTGQNCMCAVPPFASTPPQIPFTAGPAFVTTWNTAYQPIDQGRTPLSEGLQAADKALTDTLPTLTGTTIVVVVTDGAPNCQLDGLPINEQISILTPLPTKWLGMGVKTYVLGLPGDVNNNNPTGMLDPNAEMVLNAVANAGGTTKYIPASDPMTVQTELAKIIGESVTSNFESCMIPLEKKPPDPNDVNLVVTMGGQELAVDRDLGDAGGWTIDGDQTHIILQGRFCELARMGEYQNITVVFGCVDVPPLPKPPPPM